VAVGKKYQMKTHKNLFNKVCSFENLLLAFKKSQKGSNHKLEVKKYNFLKEKNLLELQEKLISETYEPSAYHYFKISEPKERIISVATFEDRIVHHAIVNILEPIYEKIFYYHSYATRKNKGSHKAVFYAQNCLKSNNWYLKSDIKKYFENISHQLLIDSIKNKISDKKLLNLIIKIIYNANSNGIGIPIGNLTSQFFANVFLNSFDDYIKNELKMQFYVRYMDDFVIFSNEKEELKTALNKIEIWLQTNLNLQIKNNATYINSASNGLSFLGTRIFAKTIRIKPENLKRFIKKINEKKFKTQKHLIPENKYEETLNSYNALMCVYSTYQLRLSLQKKGIWL